MPLKKTVLCLVFIAFYLSGYSFFRPMPGYYVDLKGDTIRCNVEYGDWYHNPKSVQVQLGNKTEEFGPTDIKGFGIFGYNQYESATVSIHTGTISGGVYPDTYSDSTETKTCFLRILDKNAYSLYLLAFPSREYFFISSPTKPIAELVYRVKSVGDSVFVDQQYKHQVMEFFNEEGITANYFTSINKLSYNAAPLENLFTALNESHTGVKIKKQKKGGFSVDVFAGATFLSFPAELKGYYGDSYTLPSQVSPSVGISFLYSIPVHFNAFQVGLSMGYYKYSHSKTVTDSATYVGSENFYYTDRYTGGYSVSNSLLYGSLFGRYIFNPLSATKIYLKAGVNYNFSVGGTTNIVDSYTGTRKGIKNGTVPFEDDFSHGGTVSAVKKKFITITAAGGVKFGRSALEFSYTPPTQISELELDPVSNPEGFKIGSFGINFVFTLFGAKHNS